MLPVQTPAGLLEALSLLALLVTLLRPGAVVAGTVVLRRRRQRRSARLEARYVDCDRYRPRPR